MAGVLVPTRVGGVEVLVETVPVPGSERTSGRLEEAGQRVVEAFDRAQETITALASQLAGTLAAMGERAVRPDHVEVQFGLSFTAQGGIVVAGVGSQASLQVTLSYDRPGTEPSASPLRPGPGASPRPEPSE
ncbi:CU044_2847 family protein [Streptomyces sp. GESEQ-4]|uniref:CU044_2847 family protein n=1 Tax=Streptomyces sp. GESEQ-4 TaxID=2812655 RepID=UPI001B31A3BE|nr:CU044_2847 family protein [Streptomyces sp. GESEQ-4]